MHRSPSFRNKVSIVFLALGLVSSACHFTPVPVPPLIEADIHETAVWNDIMPGSPPKAHAVLHVGLRNTGADTLTIRDCNGLLADARSGEPLRRFTAVMVLDEGERQQLQIAPGATRDVHFRPVRGLPTIDTMRSPRVVLTISFDIGNGRRHALHSPPIQPFLTQ